MAEVEVKQPPRCSRCHEMHWNFVECAKAATTKQRQPQPIYRHMPDGFRDPRLGVSVQPASLSAMPEFSEDWRPRGNR